MFSIGIDIGGMSIKAGLVDANGTIITKNIVKTAKTADVCIGNMVAQINQLLSDNNLTVSDLKGIGIGCPGAVSSDSGVVNFLPNLGWLNIPLKERLQKYFDLPIIISNDANVATLAEVIYGSAKEFSTAIMFTLGTGVGGGIVIDNKLYEGTNGRGAELGHCTLIMNGKPCTCGRNGCVEAYVSATAFIEQTKEAMLKDKSSILWEYCNGDINNVDGKMAFTAEKQGDVTAQKVIDNYVMYLSESILNMLNIFRPQAFILGGGISQQGENLTERVANYLEKFDYGYKFAPKTKVITASLGNDAGIIGASALVL